MPVVVAPVLISFVILITVLVLYELLRKVVVWLRPALNFLFANHASFWRRVLLYPIRVVAAGIIHIEHAVSTSLSHAVAWALQPVTGFLNGSANIVEEIGLHLGSWAQATYDALNTLRNVTVPRLIRAAVDPVRLLAVQAKALAVDAEARIDAARVALLGALAAAGVGTFTTLAQGLQALTRYAANLHQEVWQNIKPRLDLLTSTVIPAIQANIGILINDLYNTGINSLDGLRTRLRNLEDIVGNTAVAFREAIIAALGTAAGLLALEALLTRIAPDLFCRNTKGVTKKLCGLDTALLDSILGLSLAFLVVIDPVAVAEAALVVEGEMESVIHQVAA